MSIANALLIEGANKLDECRRERDAARRELMDYRRETSRLQQREIYLVQAYRMAFNAVPKNKRDALKDPDQI